MQITLKNPMRGRTTDGKEDHAFFGTYKEIFRYFKDEYGRLTEPGVSNRVLRNPMTARIRRFHKRERDKLRREMKATLFQQVESHLLKVSLVVQRQGKWESRWDYFRGALGTSRSEHE